MSQMTITPIPDKVFGATATGVSLRDIDDAQFLDSADGLRDVDTPLGHALTDEIAGAVRRALDALPAEMRQAISLREFDGLSYEEIAEVMDCPVGTVRSRIFRARESIDEVLAPLLDNS